MIFPTFARELEVAERAARQAGALILGYRGQKVPVDTKAGNEPVTRADREASELIVAALHAAFPDDVVVSEEGADDARRLAQAETGVRVWFVDPLDGTRDFIQDRPGFAVMIGLCVAGRPRLGVIYQPVGDRLFTAAQGHGSRVQDQGGTRALRCSQVTDLGRVRLVASRSHRTREIDAVKSALGIADEMNIGSVGLKLGLIALAERDLYVNPSSKSKAWDTCAPEALLHEAGGLMTDLWGSPLQYDGLSLGNERGLLASNGLIHEAVLRKIRPLFP